jgi:hypothetical protein
MDTDMDLDLDTDKDTNKDYRLNRKTHRSKARIVGSRPNWMLQTLHGILHLLLPLSHQTLLSSGEKRKKKERKRPQWQKETQPLARVSCYIVPVLFLFLSFIHCFIRRIL